MELWIRSQNKESLTKVNNISLKEIRKPYTNEIECYGIGTYYDNLQVLGKYNSKERTLEVLEEIQTKILRSVYYKASEDYGKHNGFKNTFIENYGFSYVYEMPEE